MSPATALACLLLLPAPLAGAGTEPPAGVVELQGGIECFDQELEPLPTEEACHDLSARFGLRTASGDLVLFLAHDPHAEMFVDPEVRSRDLVVRGWHREERLFEILAVYSLKEGRLHDLHYRCDVCNITAKAPGPCWCCRQPFELREVPVAEPDGDRDQPLAAPVASPEG